MRVLVGTYAAKGGPGLVPIVRERAGWRLEDAHAQVRDASWAIASPRHDLRYVVNEMADMVTAHRGAAWEKVAEMPSGGEAPCHLALSRDGGRMAIANYAIGSVTLVELNERGLPRAAETWPGTGGGPDAERQDGPHAHWVGFAADGTPIRVDLGADRIFGGVGPMQRPLYVAPPGSGPRHLALYPDRPLAYLVSELASTLTVLRTDAAPWTEAAILSTLPDGAGASLGGAIALDAAARRLFVTNRGHDSIATFVIEPDGMPRLLRHTASGGASPRFVLPLADQVLVAHEEAGGVAIFALAADGAPAGTPQRLAIPGAAFLMIDETSAD
jgi:6-phosphogluconolactonase